MSDSEKPPPKSAPPPAQPEPVRPRPDSLDKIGKSAGPGGRETRED